MMRPRANIRRPSTVPVIGDPVAPLPSVGFIADPYELAANATAPAESVERCTHHTPPGVRCLYCKHDAAFVRVPHAIEHAGEHELAELLRRLITECRDTWKADARAKWKGNWDRYLAWYLSRRLIGAGGITVDVGA